MTVDIYSPTANDGLGLLELELYNLVMDYRARNGLPAIPLSAGLTITAGRHAADTYYNIWEAGLTLPFNPTCEGGCEGDGDVPEPPGLP